MKNSICLFIILLITSLSLSSQVNLENVDHNKVYVVFTHDGAEFVGKIISHDQKEVLIKTAKMGEVSVPTYQLKELREAKSIDISNEGNYVKDNLFATRYFITTNGLDIKKGDSYILLNWFGPDVQYGLADNLSVGLMTSWLGTPVIGSVKYSMPINDNMSVGIGALVGTLGWASIETGGALPFAAFTVGNRKNNITLSAGYGAIWYDGFIQNVEGEALMSVAGMLRVNNSLSLIFDSFIVPGVSSETPFTALVIPGIRFQRKEKIAFQLGLTGIYTEDYYEGGSGFSSFAIPMVQVFFKF